MVAEAAARPTAYRAHSFVLASGGWPPAESRWTPTARSAKPCSTSLSPAAGGQRAAAIPPTYLEEQPLDRVGVPVDDRLRPTDADGRTRYENLHAAGATLAGAAPWREASGNGLSLATGFAAAGAILESTS